MHGRVRRHGWLRTRRFGTAEIKFFAFSTTGNRLRGLGAPLDIDFADWFLGPLRDQNEERLLIELIDVDPESSSTLQSLGYVKIGDLFYKVDGMPRQSPNYDHGANQDWTVLIESSGTAKVA